MNSHCAKRSVVTPYTLFGQDPALLPIFTWDMKLGYLGDEVLVLDILQFKPHFTHSVPGLSLQGWEPGLAFPVHAACLLHLSLAASVLWVLSPRGLTWL